MTEQKQNSTHLNLPQQQNLIIIPRKSNQFRGVSQIYNQKQTPEQEFQARFKGKTSLMSKEGHLGIVQNTLKPINKEMEVTPQKRSDYLNHSSSTQEFLGQKMNQSVDFNTIGYTQEKEGLKNGADFAKRHKRNQQSSIPTSSTMISALDCRKQAVHPFKMLLALIAYLQVGLNRSDIASKDTENSVRFTSLTSIGAGQGPIYQRAVSNQININGSPALLVPMTFTNQQNQQVPASSFYSHMPFGLQSGYSNVFQIQSIPLQQLSPIQNYSQAQVKSGNQDTSGYGTSFTANFTKAPHQMQNGNYALNSSINQSMYHDQGGLPMISSQGTQGISRSSFRSIQHQQQQTSYMQSISSGASKYQEFVNQINKQKLDQINKTNATLNESQQIQYLSPLKQYPKVYENSVYDNTPLSHQLQRKTRRALKLAKSTEVSSFKRGQQQQVPI
ncbi:UNKNOWN [Stylonychia lemnae]|uniref:Uncharacterized protein n=1 Tax=Stylonychia lemnae TaxID=5949 RepID=A0A078B8A0_STYLE|nr:UNKNOWN [Stylonychia lemnae]|eukprot:CDW89517.1 UNKNOWN [Stylonychia lemnae]